MMISVVVMQTVASENNPPNRILEIMRFIDYIGANKNKNTQILKK